MEINYSYKAAPAKAIHSYSIKNCMLKRVKQYNFDPRQHL